ncbi:putative aminoacyl-tRNA hydrolase [Rhizodiscina lignyota]|uniref:D-aminoacyl-tRNA deacylase n=1 Tax=Rhizodiscina lignyota TaxID=1504668 RepID=A0A9P4M1Q9_9PEZI|nr:putative aminoacyl-tRNA hydrolase [Rhizodiscina lignyota]
MGEEHRRCAVLQRVKSASVTVDGKLISSIGKGVLVFAGLGKDDTDKDVESMAGKVLKMKLWDDEKGGKWKHSVQDIQGEILCVSQFTLLATTKKGNKPDFHKSAGAEKARELYTKFFSRVQELYDGEKVKDGIFQAMMDVALVNDGPVGVDYRCEDGAVTLEIDTDPPKMDLPGGSVSTSINETMDMSELLGKMAKLNTEFKIPAELLE